ncbi:Uncharacterized protein APZ42_017296 [Daphnia magna]|uniref:Uncharacterized protein n=1 Tax=Daphnia magna TaxID=35525 RepID=A0A0P5XXM2_9CRUS|nr:Uncharacterized protein APZ42_017296 [Daphnia magna]
MKKCFKNPSTMELARRVVGKNKNRGRNAEGNQKQKRRRNKYRAQKSNVSVNVLAPEVATQEEAIGDGDPLILDVMPSTSGDVTSHKTDVVADAYGNEEDMSARTPLNRRVTARMITSQPLKKKKKIILGKG